MSRCIWFLSTKTSCHKGSRIKPVVGEVALAYIYLDVSVVAEYVARHVEINKITRSNQISEVNVFDNKIPTQDLVTVFCSNPYNWTTGPSPNVFYRAVVNDDRQIF